MKKGITGYGLDNSIKLEDHPEYDHVMTLEILDYGNDQYATIAVNKNTLIEILKEFE